MLLSRRAAAVAPWRLSRRAGSTAPWARLLSSEAVAPAASEASFPATPKNPVDSEPAQSAAPTGTPSVYKAKAVPAASKWVPRARSVKPAPAPAPPTHIPPPAQYTPKTIAHEAHTSPGDEGEAAAQDWATSFHGVSTKPVSEEQFKVLLKPIDEKDVEVKPDGVIYLPEIKYRRRLNEAFGPMGWGMIPKGEPVVGASIVTREYALIADGRFVSQAQGENSFFNPDQLPSAVEGCKSNALMRCCKDLGIGSELWDPHYVRWFKKTHMEEVWVEHVTTKKKRTFWYRKGMADVAYPYKATR